MADILEIKRLLEEQGQAWNEFKRTNDELMQAKAEGKAVADLETKLNNIGERLDQIEELKADFDKFMLASQRPGAGEGKQDELEAECKQWNAMLRADFQSKGRPAPAEVTPDQYAEYKSAFFSLVRHGNMELLTTEQRKAMSAGSDPDGGYLLPAPTVGRVVKKIYEQSTMRQLATVQTISTDSLEGIIDNDEADAGWVSEMGARNDTDTPQLGKYRIEAHEMYAQPKVTQKLIDDAATDVEAWLASKVADKYGRIEGAAFWTGNGVGKPHGLAAYPTAATSDDTRAWGTFEHVITGANGAFHSTKADPLQDLIGAFKDQYLNQLEEVRRKQEQASTALGAGAIEFNKYGMSAKQTAAALRGVPAQLTDIFVSLQGGQRPMTVLIQQGGQLKDMFGGIVPAARALGSTLLGMVNPITVAAAAAGTLFLAYRQGAAEMEAFNSAITISGGIAGVTSGQLAEMAASLLSLTGCGLLGEKKSASSFCDIYTVVDMPSEQAARVDQPYRGRILANERWELERCP